MQATTPRARETHSGAKITSLSLATSRSYKDAQDQRQTETEWHRITCFNGIGKNVSEHVAKGAMLMVTGRIHYTRWTNQNGTERYGCEIIADQVDFLVRGKGHQDRTRQPRNLLWHRAGHAPGIAEHKASEITLRGLRFCLDLEERLAAVSQ